jgi:hypothetical protein
MTQHNILDFLSHCWTDTCIQPLGFTKYETHVYLVFCIFNVVRIFTYLPTVVKLRAAGCTGDGQSIWTWACWILANSSLSYYAYISSKYQVTDFVWISIMNSLMCCICFYYVVKVQKRAGTLTWLPFRVPKNELLTLKLTPEVSQPIAAIALKTGTPVNTLIALAMKEFLAKESFENKSNSCSFQARHVAGNSLQHKKLPYFLVNIDR